MGPIGVTMQTRGRATAVEALCSHGSGTQLSCSWLVVIEQGAVWQRAWAGQSLEGNPMWPVHGALSGGMGRCGIRSAKSLQEVVEE